MVSNEKYYKLWKKFNLSESNSFPQEVKNKFIDIPRNTNKCNGGYITINQYWYVTLESSGNFYCEYCYSQGCHDKDTTCDESILLFTGKCMCTKHAKTKTIKKCVKCSLIGGQVISIPQPVKLCDNCKHFAIFDENHKYCDDCVPDGLCKCGDDLPNGKNICITCPGSHSVSNVKMYQYKNPGNDIYITFCSFCYNEGCHKKTDIQYELNEINLAYAKCHCKQHGEMIVEPSILYCNKCNHKVIVGNRDVCQNCKYYITHWYGKGNKYCVFCAEKLNLCPCGNEPYSFNYII